MKYTFLTQAKEGNKTALIKREIIRQYLFGGDCSLTDMSKEMNLSVPTVTKLVGELLEEGFVHDFGKQGTNGGRRPNIYGLNPDAGYFVGVDIKNGTIELGMINFKGRLLDYRNGVEFMLENSVESLDKLCDLIQEYIDSMSISLDKVISIGVNLSGRVNSDTGYSYSYYFSEGKPLVELLEERLDCVVNIENDSRAMTYGEYMCGNGNDSKNMIFINASWGLGVGLVLNSRLFYGNSGFSGEYGHFPFFENEIICRCGKRGCLETGASGSAIHRIFTDKLRDGRVSMLSEKFNDKGGVTIEDIMSAVQKEDVLAIEVIEEVAHNLGRAIAGLINLINPEMIVIGGTLATAGDSLMLTVKSAVNKYSLKLVSKETTIKLSKLGEKTGVIGACMLVRSKILGFL